MVRETSPGWWHSSHIGALRCLVIAVYRHTRYRPRWVVNAAAGVFDLDGIMNLLNQCRLLRAGAHDLALQLRTLNRTIARTITSNSSETSAQILILVTRGCQVS